MTHSSGTAAPRLAGVPDWGPRTLNRDVSLTPIQGSADDVVAYDFPGVEVGVATYPEGPTGCTVVHVPAGARMAIDARGGAIGMSSGYEYFAHAICLAGGSVYGLSAGSGVADELRLRNGNRGTVDDLALVSTAVIYDFSARATAIIPDAALGRAAVRDATHGAVPVGRIGAGASASAGKIDYARTEITGQGAAFGRIGDVRVLVVTVPNPVGVIVDRTGAVVRGNFDERDSTRSRLEPAYLAAIENAQAGGARPEAQRGNTTITTVVTNVRLSEHELIHFSRQVHSSMNRAIQPFHTALDGDTLFALTTDEVDLVPGSTDGSASVDSLALGAFASELAWDAVLCAAR
ncbi:MAG: P1 family peptidase [Candidatus Microbacterium colombiense]|nr:MAG: P1 family peptidase [Microbacterium sp.]